MTTGTTTDTRSRWFHAAVATVIAVSLIIQFVVTLSGGVDVNTGGSTSEIPLGTRLVRLFSFFTIQSNIIALVATVGLALRPDRDGKLWRVLRLDAVLGMVITGLVFAIVLAPIIHVTGAASVANTGLHYIAPWAVLLGWLLFGPGGRITWSVVGWAFVWPVAWLVYTFVRGAFADWYPYPFLDVIKLGYGQALLNAGLVVVLGVFLAWLFKLLDTRLPLWRSG